MTTKKTVVLYPSLGVGHLNPMAQLAKAILRHGDGVAVTIAVVDPPEKHAALAAAVARLAAVSPSITVHLLPIPPSATSKQHSYSHPIVPILAALRAANPALRAFLASRVPAVDAIVVDMFCTDALDTAAELAIPTYFFYPSAAADLAVYLQIPDLFRGVPSSPKDMGKAALTFAGVPAVRALDLPDTMQDWESDVGSVRMRQLAQMPEAAGFLVNSFESLEPRALKALRDGHCLPGRSTPKIYCVGPLVDGGGAEGNGERHACLEWLDEQPRQSVVFLCFGSLGAFTAAQLKETARGLERSGHRFLWTVRSRSSREWQSSGEPDLEALLPDGFLERTRGRGLVLKNWAPQTQVLRHEAVGAFVTHCGWNSVLEAVMSGVPMICWPLYAEQRLNKVHVVEELKFGVVMEGYDEELVTADEVEAKVRLVMESEVGEKLRERTVMAKAMAADAVKEGGPSHVELGEFLRGLGCK